MVKSQSLRIVAFTLFVILVATINFAKSNDWPQWRGPNLNGSSDAKNLPESWNENENIAWVSPLPGPGGATPVIYGDKVFVSSMIGSTNDLAAICIDIKDGSKLWEKKVAASNVRLNNNNPASPSPVTDGKTVVFFYGSGDLAAFDYEGEKIWSRNLIDDYGTFSISFGYSASPLIFQDKLYIIVIRRNTSSQRGASSSEQLDSYLLALDLATGENIWKQPRPTNATSESMESYTTPVPFNNNGRYEILNIGSDHITSNDPNNGGELWRYEYQTDKVRDARIVPSILTIGNLIIGTRYKHHGVFALKPPSPGGDSKPELVWDVLDPSPDVSTPLYYKNRLYVLNGVRGIIACLEPETGNQIWKSQINGRGPWRASLLGADDKLYCANESGEVIVLAAGDEFKILFETKINESPIRSSIAAAQDKLFIRTSQNLYCIGK